MPTKSTPKTITQKVGLALFVTALLLFVATLGLNRYRLTEEALTVDTDYHHEALWAAAQETGMAGRDYSSSLTFNSAFKEVFDQAQQKLTEQAADGLPEGVAEWDFKLGDWKRREYALSITKEAAEGPVVNHSLLFFFLTIGLGILGGLLYILPQFRTLPGIKHDHIFHSPMTRGLNLGWRSGLALATSLGIIVYGFYYTGKQWFWPVLTLAVAGLITLLVMWMQSSAGRKGRPGGPAGPSAWLGIFTGLCFIGFYILLYWAPQHITAWMIMANPLSRALNGGPASQWFLYGLLYTLVMIVMGVRMIAKYRHNRYQLIRTGSVIFFQTAFAFLLPEILVRLNQPYYDFKNIWPLDYDFFFEWNLNTLLNSGGLGLFMLVWGIVLIAIGVPVITYFYGKRWYCSWVCGCGGLAETLGDPYRQLSDKSLRAWRFERWIVHGVLVFAVIMTALVLYTFFSGNGQLLGLDSYSLRGWYGFLIGSAFAGVVGTGFYPLMGNRVWCRFGCPLAAYLGLVQRFKSRFRITTNGGQCISCGNCSTYCEMGIDVRWYAQRGQDVVRASCVGCGVCAAVCPRGVLRLENSSADINARAGQLRAIHISTDKLELPQP